MEFWAWFYRLLAFVHAQKPEESKKYIRQALPLLIKLLKSENRDNRKATTLYLLGEYHRRLQADIKARNYFAEAKALIESAVTEENKKSLNYLKTIVVEREALIQQPPK